MGLCLLGLAAAEHGRERLALRRVGALVDDHLHRAVALVDRAGPGVEDGKAEAVERNLTKMAALNPAGLEAAAIAAAWALLELAGTAVVAIAVAEGDGLNAPVDHGPGPPLRWTGGRSATRRRIEARRGGGAKRRQRPTSWQPGAHHRPARRCLDRRGATNRGQSPLTGEGGRSLFPLPSGERNKGRGEAPSHIRCRSCSRQLPLTFPRLRRGPLPLPEG